MIFFFVVEIYQFYSDLITAACDKKKEKLDYCIIHFEHILLLKHIVGLDITYDKLDCPFSKPTQQLIASTLSPDHKEYHER